MLLPSLARSCQRLSAILLSLFIATATQAATDEIVYFHTDAQGTPTAAFNEAGEVCWTETYSPYGEKLDNEDSLPPEEGCGLLSPNDVGYTGHVQDGSGLVYAQQRYYDPVIGRFMSTDPVLPHAGDPRYFGRYHYGANNPYKFTDPTGEGFVIAGVPPALEILGAALGLKATIETVEILSDDQAETLGNEKPEEALDTLVNRIGDAFPDRDLPRNPDGTPAPEHDVPHTQLGSRKSRRGGRYPQAREFDADGKPVRDIDVTDHGRPEEHDNPHQHDYEPNETGGTPSRGDSKPLEYQ